jgi:hypothetical protein
VSCPTLFLYVLRLFWAYSFVLRQSGDKFSPSPKLFEKIVKKSSEHLDSPNGTKTKDLQQTPSL